MSAEQSLTPESERVGAENDAFPVPHLITQLRRARLRRVGESEMLEAWDTLVAEWEQMRSKLQAPVVVTHAMRRSFDDAVVKTNGFYLDAGIVAVIEAWREER